MVHVLYGNLEDEKGAKIRKYRRNCSIIALVNIVETKKTHKNLLSFVCKKRCVIVEDLLVYNFQVSDMHFFFSNVFFLKN